MTPEFIDLGAGMTLIYIHTEKFKAEYLSVAFARPTEPETSYLTSLLLSVLLRGTRALPTVSALNKRLDYLYGTTHSSDQYHIGDSTVVKLTLELLNSRFIPGDREDLISAAANLTRDIFFDPVLDEDGLLSANYVEGEKKLQCETIRAQKDNPRGYAKNRCTDLMFAGEPYGVNLFGTEEAVAAVTPRMLTEHWRNFLAAFLPDFVYVGAEPKEHVMKSLTDAFLPAVTTHRKPSAEAVRYQCRIIRQAEREKREEEKTPFSQGHLVIGMRTGTAVTDPEFYDCMVMNELFGGSPISKLFVNVREKLSLCYSVYSAYNIYKGALLISCSLDSKNRQTAEDEIFRQIEAIKAGNFSEEELLAAKKSLESGCRLLEDRPAGLGDFYYRRSLPGVRTSPETMSAGVNAVTREGVIRAAKKLSVDTVFFLRGTGKAGSGEEDGND